MGIADILRRINMEPALYLAPLPFAVVAIDARGIGDDLTFLGTTSIATSMGYAAYSINSRQPFYTPYITTSAGIVASGIAQLRTSPHPNPEVYAALTAASCAVLFAHYILSQKGKI